MSPYCFQEVRSLLASMSLELRWRRFLRPASSSTWSMAERYKWNCKKPSSWLNASLGTTIMQACTTAANWRCFIRRYFKSRSGKGELSIAHAAELSARDDGFIAACFFTQRVCFCFQCVHLLNVYCMVYVYRICLTRRPRELADIN